MSLSTHQTLVDVVYHEARCIDEQRWDEWLALYTDDTEGYWLNASAPAPSFFVMWRLQDGPDGPDSLAVPLA